MAGLEVPDLYPRLIQNATLSRRPKRIRLRKCPLTHARMLTCSHIWHRNGIIVKTMAERSIVIIFETTVVQHGMIARYLPRSETSSTQIPAAMGCVDCNRLRWPDTWWTWCCLLRYGARIHDNDDEREQTGMRKRRRKEDLLQAGWRKCQLLRSLESTNSNYIYVTQIGLLHLSCVQTLMHPLTMITKCHILKSGLLQALYIVNQNDAIFCAIRWFEVKWREDILEVQPNGTAAHLKNESGQHLTFTCQREQQWLCHPSYSSTTTVTHNPEHFVLTSNSAIVMDKLSEIRRGFIHLNEGLTNQAALLMPWLNEIRGLSVLLYWTVDNAQCIVHFLSVNHWKRPLSNSNNL